jgi:putative oxidoreductase
VFLNLIMKITTTIVRILLGLIYLVFGLNFFFHFLNMPQPVLSKEAMAFEGGLFGAGYFFPFMKVIEILAGLSLLINRFTALFALIIFPVTLNIFLFHTILAPAGAPLGIVMFLLNAFLGFAYRKQYAGLFTAVPVVA